MKYVITGSIGHISQPIVKQLVAAGQQVVVVTSKAANKGSIEALGAIAAVGSVADKQFITATFAGADVVYLMIPPRFDVTDWFAHQQNVADIYVEAVKANHIKYAVVLSSVGAHMKKGAGPVDGLAYLEDQLNTIEGLNARYLRPSYFYYNLFGQINTIKHAGIVASSQPATHKLVLTHTSDIADAALHFLLNPTFTGKQVTYIASDDTHTWAEITNVLSQAVGKPGIPYVEASDEQAAAAMQQAGLPPAIVNGYVQMGGALRSGEMVADYWQHKEQAVIGKVKLADFAKEFAAAYNA